MTQHDDTNRPNKLPRPHQLAHLSPDQVVAVVLRLAMEISVLRERLKTHEQLLAEHNLLSPDDVEHFTPSEADNAARHKARTELIESIISDLS